MSSNWGREVWAVIRKEAVSEARDKKATFTGGMLSVATVFTLAFAFYDRQLTPESAAGMLWAALLFAGVGTLVRSFVAEDEQGTGDLLRMWGRPEAVFWGKAAFAFVQMTATAIVVAILFVTLTGTPVTNWGLFLAALIAGSASFAGIITLVSSIISRGANRGTLGGVVALPLLLPIVALGVNAGKGAFDAQAADAGWRAAFGLACYAALVLALAPHQFVAVWREP